MHSLRSNRGGGNLLLNACEQELVGLLGLLGEVLLFGEQAGEVDNTLVNEHASDSSG